MKASSIVFGCILFGVAACSAPQGKKLTASSGGLAPVAAGPAEKVATLTAPANLTSGTSGENVNLARNGTVTVTLKGTDNDGYKWRLAEIPDPTVLKMVSKNFVLPTDPEGVGQEKWVFQAVGPGEVDVKMWYGDVQATPMTGNPTFDFVASVSEETKPEKKTTKKTKKAPKVAEAQ